MNNKQGKIYCHDCKKDIEVNKKVIKNGFMLVYKDGDEEVKVYKCKECYDKNPALTNFRECEIYSRIVGYLRPVRQWHIGKKQEFEDRKTFELKNNQ